MINIREEIKSLFESEKIEYISYQAFIDFEIRLYVLNLLRNKISVQTGWSVFTQYFYDFIQQEEIDEIKDYLYKLRFDNHNFSNRGKWQGMMGDYLSVPSRFRMYDITEERELIRITPRFAHKREEAYKQILKEMPTTKKREAILAEIEDEVTYEKKAYTVPIIEMPQEYIEPLKEYKSKKYIELRTDYDWQSTLSQMGKQFVNRPKIQLKILNENQSIPLKGMIHIVGALGAGKSTYKYAQVMQAVKEHHLKVGMIEESVSHVIETVNILRRLGIEAVPIIGSSNEEKYLSRYFDKFTSYIDIIDDEMIKELSGGCIIKALAEDRNTIGFPCNKLYQSGQRVSCTYAGSCGHMRRFRKLARAQVIVTTPHSLVRGNLVDTIDPYQRSIYEMLHDLMDMIIVDEVDSVQSILEDQLMMSVKLNYGEYNVLGQFEDLAAELKRGRTPMKRNDKYKFIANYNLLNTVIDVARRVLGKYSHIHYYILNKCLTPIEAFNNIKSILAREESNERFIDFLEEYVSITDVFSISEENIDHRLYRIFNKVIAIHLEEGKFPEIKLKEDIENLLKEYEVTIPLNQKGKQFDKERIIEQIGLLVILVQVDYLVKMLSEEYPYLYYEVHQEMRYIEGFRSPNMKLSHLIKEPCIGSIYGYKIAFKNELEIDILRYAAVGRSMLQKWSTLKEEIGLEGPAVICLSGTSHSPGSAHYHLEKEPDILLLGKSEGKIEMHYCPQVDKAKYIRISGASEESRNKNLKLLTDKLVVSIKNQLIVDAPRKILMIVNSYEDCQIVGEALDYRKLNYKVICNEEGENYLPKEALENFEEESDEADICIVPLTIIARGYNILNQYGDSYFGNMYFLVRPYMVPGDFSSYIQILHHSMLQTEEEIKESKVSYDECIETFRKRCFAEFSSILNMRYWKGLTDKQREIMTWFMLIPMKQAIGRMQRNGNDCKVYFCDSAFCDGYGSVKEINSVNSTLHSFYDVLGKYKGNRVLDSLYHQFYEGLGKMIREIDEQNKEELEEVY